MFELGREVTHEVRGKRYTFGRLERRLIEEFRDWIAEQIGDPFADVDRFIDKIPAADAREMIKEARAIKDQLASFSLGCPLAQRYLATELGMGQLVYLMLRDQHEGITPDEAFAVAAELGARETAKAISKASGTPPKQAPAKNAAAPAA